MPLCSFGVLRTGAAYQPLDPSYPKERLNYMMKDAGAKLLICDRDLRSLVDEYDGNVIFTDEIELDCTKILKQNQNEDGTKCGANGIFNCADIKGEDAFIILYTSGTTGVPKGVVLEHRNLAAIISYQLRVSAINQNTKYAAYASYGFDANMLDTYPVLCGGGELHILDEEIRLDLGAIEEYFKKNQITHAFMTTQVGRAFAEMTDCESLKYLSTGGEKLVPLKFKKDLEFINLYGPTECAIYVTSAKIASGQSFIPIGKPNDNLILYIVDNNNIYLTGFFVMIMSTILGMGVPGVAAYVIVQAVAVPVLIDAGTLPLTSHLFCLVYACLSNITPPVAISAYVASGIAGSDQTKTGLWAMRLGIIGFIIPFFFLDNPVLLVGVDPNASMAASLWAVFTALLGTAGLVAGLEGWLVRRCNFVERAVLIALAPLLLYPGLVTDAIGIAIFVALIAWQWMKK